LREKKTSNDFLTFFFLKWLMTLHWWLSMRNNTNQCTYRYVNLPSYTQRSLLRVSASHWGHLQGRFFEVCSNDWQKHVAGYAVYNKVNLYTSIWSIWLYLS
jgi:hypothetical protein